MLSGNPYEKIYLYCRYTACQYFFIAQMAGGPECIEDYGNNVRKICTPKENVILWEQNFGQSADNDAVRKVKYDKADLNDFFFSENTRFIFWQRTARFIMSRWTHCVTRIARQQRGFFNYAAGYTALLVW